jgi:hypothetical protein
MGEQPADPLLKIVNNSGFLFQLGVDTNVAMTYDEHGWKVAAREYPWSREDGTGGFIDIILWKDITRLVVECKRTRDASWVFLALWDTDEERFRCCWADYAHRQQPHAGWFDVRMSPPSPIAEFCMVRGQGEGEISMLERICSPLISAVDSLAAEELQMAQTNQYPSRLIYIPVIVTTANLHLCVADPQKISLGDGTIPEASFKSVPFVRFNKSLATRLPDGVQPRELSHAAAERERSVFIVNSDHLVAFLRAVSVRRPHGQFAEWPWTVARNREVAQQ